MAPLLQALCRTPPARASYNRQLCPQVPAERCVLSFPCTCGWGKEGVSWPTVLSASPHLPACALQPWLPHRLRHQEPGFSHGPEFLPGHLCLSPQPFAPHDPPAILSKVKAPAPHIQLETGASQTVHFWSVSPVALGCIQTRFLSWDIWSLDSVLGALSCYTAGDQVDFEAPLLRRSWCGPLISGEEGGPQRVHFT